MQNLVSPCYLREVATINPAERVPNAEDGNKNT